MLAMRSYRSYGGQSRKTGKERSAELGGMISSGRAFESDPGLVE
jgi:hypothetical protein